MMQEVRTTATSLTLDILSEKITCHSDKFITLDQHRILIISDLHLGKIDHFRKHGFGLPSGLDKHDFAMLENIFLHFKPDLCIFLGDLFHSEYNQSWDQFDLLLKSFTAIDFVLVEGNHDILHPELYEASGIRCLQEMLVGPLLLSHEPVEPPLGQYNIHGHIHPGYALRGKGRQHLLLPCFHFGKRQATMPAFGRFTGLHGIQASKEDTLVLISKSELFPVTIN